MTPDDFIRTVEEKYLTALAWRAVFFCPGGGVNLFMYASNPEAREIAAREGVFIGTFAILDAQEERDCEIEIDPLQPQIVLFFEQADSDPDEWVARSLRSAAESFAANNRAALLAEAASRREGTRQ